jgi:hypothetical protein
LFRDEYDALAHEENEVAQGEPHNLIHTFFGR